MLAEHSKKVGKKLRICGAIFMLKNRETCDFVIISEPFLVNSYASKENIGSLELLLYCHQRKRYNANKRLVLTESEITKKGGIWIEQTVRSDPQRRYLKHCSALAQDEIGCASRDDAGATRSRLRVG